MTINAGKPSEKLQLQMKRFQEQNELKTRDEKIKLMNDRQKQWMEERKGSRPSNSQVRNQGKAQGGVPHHLPKPKKQNSSLEKKTSNEVLLWTSKNPEITSDGFVVRKPPGKSGSRALSRSSKSNSTSRPSSSRSAAGQEVDRETRSIRRLENTLDLMTSTPERTLSSDVADFEITKDISSIRISAMKDKEKVSNTNGNLPVHSSHQLSTYIEDGQEEKSNYKGLSILGNSSYKPIIHIGDKQNGNSTFAMHCCPSCNTLMSLQSHRPFLIIPCGHNVCAQCQPVQTDCPTCNTRISSTVENTALSHVIKEHKKQADREELARKEEEARKFVEEYDSLKTRCDVLSCKAEVVIETMENTTANLVQAKKNIKANEDRKADIHHRICCLKEELSMCETEHVNFEKECNELELSYSKEKENLDMIENTLDRVRQSKDRVKQLILGYIPSFRFEDE